MHIKIYNFLDKEIKMEYLWVVWTTVIVAAVVAEVLIPGLVAIWFVPGGIVSLILSLFSVELWIQVVVFFALSIAFLLCSRFLFRKLVTKPPMKTNIDAVIGEKCIVTERVENLAGCGQVKVKGMEWSARTIDESETLAVGDVVTVVAVEGVKLIVRR